MNKHLLIREPVEPLRPSRRETKSQKQAKCESQETRVVGAVRPIALITRYVIIKNKKTYVFRAVFRTPWNHLNSPDPGVH